MNSMIRRIDRQKARQTDAQTESKKDTAGLQLRKTEQNGFHDYFLISQPNPMM